MRILTTNQLFGLVCVAMISLVSAQSTLTTSVSPPPSPPPPPPTSIVEDTWSSTSHSSSSSMLKSTQEQPCLCQLQQQPQQPDSPSNINSAKMIFGSKYFIKHGRLHRLCDCDIQTVQVPNLDPNFVISFKIFIFMFTCE